MTDQAAGQFRASKFVGIDVYGSDNQKIGDINEILIDPTGNAKGVVIGVGGFLGIGEKNVAVAWSALEWKMERPAANQTGAANTAPSGSTAGTGAAGGMNTANRSTAADTTASTSAGPGAPALSTAAAGASAGATRSPAETAAYNGYPDHAVLAMSKADLQNAPTFKYYSETHSASGGASNAAPGATAPGSAAPRQ
jgi:sporulation protein YlmC with PRC-barrel domain